MILKIQGSDKKIKQIARELKIRARKGNLKLSLKKSKQEASKPSNGDKQKLDSAASIIEAVKTASIEDLKKFESDSRVTVIKAIEVRKLELEESK